MMRKLFAALAISLVAGCAAGVDATTENEGARVSESADALASGNQDLTCPACGTCDKASDYCEDPETDPYCDILTRCFNCGYPENCWSAAPEEPPAQAAKAEAPSAPVESAAAVGNDTQNLWCPACGTCERANILCEDPENDPECKTLTQCLMCGWPENC
ncbi:hypothetical protein [Polyangium aurulentum]|uniref:hypothetical protein n=1 Tax=Polyangium aurulentum TaxID=2567896 RepID=UPI0010AEB9A6|nr:hypothetical protein [Polyangium aurulentum]UQA62751.1 hypothetical protein E8A73_020800 [Polyangium aurulentum]